MAYRWHGRSLGGGHRVRQTPPDAPGGDETEPRHRRDKTETLSWKLIAVIKGKHWFRLFPVGRGYLDTPVAFGDFTGLLPE